MSYELPSLPYADTDLQPHISAEVINLHYGKHTKKYFEVANQLAKGTIFEDHTLKDVNKENLLKMGAKLFNNVSQAWNHVFYWESLTPHTPDNVPAGDIKDAIVREYGSVAAFTKEFTDQATKLFGSGWTWLVLDGSKLRIKNTSNAGTPLTEAGVTPLLVCDVWEHAYYPQYPADRAAYIDAWWKVVNWSKVNERFKEAQ